MALQATVHRVQIDLSDVDRGVYEQLDLRVARHPSETARWLLTRTLAYALCHEEGIAFSKGGLSSTDEAPVSIRDATGRLRAHIEVGAPSAERLHRAAKAADRVVVFTEVDPERLRRDARAFGRVHRADEIALVLVPAALIDALERHLERNLSFGLSRNDGVVYLTVGGETVEGTLVETTLEAPPG